MAVEIGDRIRRLEDVAEGLCDEWAEDLSLIKNLHLRRAEQSVHPVLDTLRDQVYYLG